MYVDLPMSSGESMVGALFELPPTLTLWFASQLAPMEQAVDTV